MGSWAGPPCSQHYQLLLLLGCSYVWGTRCQCQLLYVAVVLLLAADNGLLAVLLLGCLVACTSMAGFATCVPVDAFGVGLLSDVSVLIMFGCFLRLQHSTV